MKDYIISILYVAVFSMLIELILPSTKLKKYILTFVSLLLIINIISPVVEILKAKNVEDVLNDVAYKISREANNNLENSSYDFSKYSLTDSVKEKIEESIKERFGEDKIQNVNIILDKEYKVEDVEVHIARGIEKMSNMEVSDFIQSLSDEYNIVQSKIKIIEVSK